MPQGVEGDFRAQWKVRPAFLVEDLDALAGCLEGAGRVVTWDDLLSGRRRS